MTLRTPTEQQIIDAAEKAGLWPNTVRNWIPAFHRYHAEIAKSLAAPAQQVERQELSDEELVDAARESVGFGRVELVQTGSEGEQSPTNVARCFARAILAKDRGQA